MTTIAWKAGVLVADSSAWRGDKRVPAVAHKLHVGPGGSMIAKVGNAVFTQGVVDMLLRGEEPSFAHMQTTEDWVVVEILSAGAAIRVWEHDGVSREDADIHAWGSGWQVAIGAMLAGASAEEAVKIAARIDAFTGGDIYYLMYGMDKPEIWVPTPPYRTSA